MADFRTRLRLKPELWLGCEIKEFFSSPSGRAVCISFANCPFITMFDKVTAERLAYRKYGWFRPSWPDDWPEHLLLAGDTVCVSVSVRSREFAERPGQIFIAARIVV